MHGNHHVSPHLLHEELDATVALCTGPRSDGKHRKFDVLAFQNLEEVTALRLAELIELAVALGPPPHAEVTRVIDGAAVHVYAKGQTLVGGIERGDLHALVDFVDLLGLACHHVEVELGRRVVRDGSVNDVGGVTLGEMLGQLPNDRHVVVRVRM